MFSKRGFPVLGGGRIFFCDNWEEDRKSISHGAGRGGRVHRYLGSVIFAF